MNYGDRVSCAAVDEFREGETGVLMHGLVPMFSAVVWRMMGL